MSGNQTFSQHPQNRKYQARIQELLGYAEKLRQSRKPILHSTLLKYAVSTMRVSDRTAKEYVKSILIIMEDSE